MMLLRFTFFFNFINSDLLEFERFCVFKAVLGSQQNWEEATEIPIFSPPTHTHA